MTWKKWKKTYGYTFLKVTELLYFTFYFFQHFIADELPQKNYLEKNNNIF